MTLTQEQRGTVTEMAQLYADLDTSKDGFDYNEVKVYGVTLLFTNEYGDTSRHRSEHQSTCSVLALYKAIDQCDYTGTGLLDGAMVSHRKQS